MSNNFSETYFYSSILDNGKLNEYGCGVKNVNDSKEYYIYDSDSKNYVTVDKEQYVDYNEKMEKLEQVEHTTTPTPPISKKNCPLTQQQKQHFKKGDCKCPLTQQQQEQFKNECPYQPPQPPRPLEECDCPQQFKQRPVQPPSQSFDDCPCYQQIPKIRIPLSSPQISHRPSRLYYPMGGYVKRIPVMNEVDVLKRENQKLRNMLKYYASY